MCKMTLGIALVIGFGLPTVLVSATNDPVAPVGTLQVGAVLTLAEAVEIPARESGVLTELLVNEGERVTAGTTLARVDDQQARFDKARAQLELEAARRQAENQAGIQVTEKAYALAQQELDRGERVNRDRPGTLSAEELEVRRLKAEAARLEIENAKIELEIARTTQGVKANEVAAAEHRIERRMIVTLVGGFVERIEAHLGEWVEPGTTVFRIVRDDRWYAEAFVPLADVRSDLTGHHVVVSAVAVDGKPITLKGVITYFSPHVGTLDNEIRIRAELERGNAAIAAGQRVTMAIERHPKLHGSQSLPEQHHDARSQ